MQAVAPVSAYDNFCAQQPPAQGLLPATSLAAHLDGCPFAACRYVVVTRPVRQGRLKLALEEVLSIHVDTPTFM